MRTRLWKAAPAAVRRNLSLQPMSEGENPQPLSRVEGSHAAREEKLLPSAAWPFIVHVEELEAGDGELGAGRFL